MRTSEELYGIDPKNMPDGFKKGLQMQLEGAKSRLCEIMKKGYMERDEKLVIDINKAISWNERKLEELQ